MNPSKYRVFVCTKKRSTNDPEGCCSNAGASDIYQTFQDEVERLELSDRVEVRQSGCLDRCEAGVVAMVYQSQGKNFSWLPTKLRIKLRKILFPNRVLYGHLTSFDVRAIAQSHFMDGKILKESQISTTK
ncbi:MAG: (2Fe-2S) ferredoxin domain-containing protein [Waterburya sp.]